MDRLLLTFRSAGARNQELARATSHSTARGSTEMKRLTTACMLTVTVLVLWNSQAFANARPESTINFGKDWRFKLGDVTNGQTPDLDDSKWRALNLPHDWSIEGEFDEKNPAGFGGGALPGGIGWYRKAMRPRRNRRDSFRRI